MKCDPFTGVAPDSRRITSCESSKQYDVFINHRGPDVKEILAKPLTRSLEEANIVANLDEKEIKLGDSLPSSIKNAILSASVHIAIFSPRYAESEWCLAEITLMLQTGATIIPVFYNVTPSDLRHNLRPSYQDAFSTHQERYRHKLKEWKESLHDVSNNMGCVVIDNANTDMNPHCKCLVSKVKELLRKGGVHFEVERTVMENRNIPLQVARCKVGLNELIEDFEEHSRQDMQVCQETPEIVRGGIVGIFGSGGSGKTTLAKEFFNRNCSGYKGSSFLFDVCETSVNGKLISLQSKLLRDLFPTWNQKIDSIEEGILLLKKSLEKSSPFLVVIDDINDPRQLNALVPLYTLNSGSLVIVTARDECVLKQADISVRYGIKTMNPQHGRQLFSWHAFDKPDPPSEYLDLVNCSVEKCEGLPLSIEVLGRYISDRIKGRHISDRIKNAWMLEIELDKVKKTSDILKLSYYALTEEEKEIFVEIACLFIDKNVNMAKIIWKAKEWDAEPALKALKNRCLVDVVPQGFDEETPASIFRMHDELRQLGRDMISERKIDRPWRQGDRRLVLKNFRKVLEIPFEIFLPTPDESFLQIPYESCRCLNSIQDVCTFFLEKSSSSTILQWLELKSSSSTILQWLELNRKCIHSWIPLQNLDVLRIFMAGKPKILWQEHNQAPLRLKELFCEFIIHDNWEKEVLKRNWNEYSRSLGKLEELECLILKLKSEKRFEVNWSSFLESVKGPACLKTLDLLGCYIEGDICLSGNRELTDCISLGCLEAITLNDLKDTSKVSISGEYCHRLKSLKIKQMEGLTEVNLEGLETLECLEVIDCSKLKKLLGSAMLKLEILRIESCSSINELPNLKSMILLKRISITFCDELQAINGLKYLSSLEDIIISGCPELPNLSGVEELKGLKAMILSGRSMWKCVLGFERLPSEFVVVKEGRAASSLEAYQFGTLISKEDVYHEFKDRKDGYKKLQSLQKSQQSFSAIILCAVVASDGRIYMDRRPRFGGTIRLSWGREEKMIYTIVVTDPSEISMVSHFIPHYCWMPTFSITNGSQCQLTGRIEEGFVLGLNKGHECDPLGILKSLIDQLYTDVVETDIETDNDPDWGSKADS